MIMSKLEGMKIVSEDLGYMITFEDEKGLVMVRDLNGEAINIKHMLKLVDLVLVAEHNESKRKKKDPVYNPNLFVREPTPTPSLTEDEKISQLENRRAEVMDQMGWLLNENMDYDKIMREGERLHKELTEIDAVLDVAR